MDMACINCGELVWIRNTTCYEDAGKKRHVMKLPIYVTTDIVNLDKKIIPKKYHINSKDAPKVVVDKANAVLMEAAKSGALGIIEYYHNKGILDFVIFTNRIHPTVRMKGGQAQGYYVIKGGKRKLFHFHIAIHLVPMPHKKWSDTTIKALAFALLHELGHLKQISRIGVVPRYRAEKLASKYAKKWIGDKK